MASQSLLRTVLARDRSDLLDEWVEYQRRSGGVRTEPLSPDDLRQQSERVLGLFAEAVASGEVQSVADEEWSDVRRSLSELARQRQGQGFTPREGAGLGLAIVKGIVEGHGGRVWLESGAGEGAAFSFTVPRSDEGCA